MTWTEYFMLFFGSAVGLFVVMWFVGTRPKAEESEGE